MDYKIIRSGRKTTTIQITPEGQVVVRCPRQVTDRQIARLVESRRDWLESHLARRRAEPVLPPFTPEELEELARQALEDIPPRVIRHARQMGVSFGRVTIRCQRTRWGSCSGKGNLNFNCLLMLAPEEVRDYVVVHELCHLLQLNHSPAFWAEVERVMPGWRAHRKWLKEQGTPIIRRIP